MFDKDVGVNWHLRFRLKIEQLQKDLELTQIGVTSLDTYNINFIEYHLYYIY